MSKDCASGAPTTICPAVLSFHVAGQVHRAAYHAGETVLETARRAGVEISSGCEKGDCGACIVNLLEGAVRMKRNNVLSPDEVASGLTLACQSLPDSAELAVEVF